MADISKITLPSGTTYDIKDAVARSQIGGAIKIKGTTTTALTDGATTNPITINGDSYTAVANDAVFYGNKEFVFDGTQWHEFGDMTGLGDLAQHDVTDLKFTGTQATISVTGTPSVSPTKNAVTVSKASSGTATYTPAGTNASSSVSGSCTVTPNGSVSETKSKVTISPASSGTATYTPAGSISVGTSTANYTPSGSVAVSSAGSTTTIKNPTAKTVVTDMSVSAPGAAATGELVYCSVSNETLTLSKFIETTGDSITTSNQTVKTGDASYAFTGSGVELKFNGTGARLETDSQVLTGASFNGESSSGTINGTAEGQTFTGTGARLITDSEVVTAVSGAATTLSTTYTPAGTIGYNS